MLLQDNWLWKAKEKNTDCMKFGEKSDIISVITKEHLVTKSSTDLMILSSLKL